MHCTAWCKCWLLGSWRTRGPASGVGTRRSDWQVGQVFPTLWSPSYASQRIYSIKRTLCSGKITVFNFVLCPHTTTPLDLLPWKMKKNQIYKSHQVTLCLCFLFVAHLAFPRYFFLLFVGAPVHSSLIANFLPIWTPYTTYMPSTPYMHTIKYIHCHCKQRDVRRRLRVPVIPD